MSNANSNGLTDLNALLFEQIRALRDPDLAGEGLKAEIDRARAVNDVAKTAVDTANSMMAAISLRNRLNIDADSHSELKALAEGTRAPGL